MWSCKEQRENNQVHNTLGNGSNLNTFCSPTFKNQKISELWNAWYGAQGLPWVRNFILIKQTTSPLKSAFLHSDLPELAPLADTKYELVDIQGNQQIKLAKQTSAWRVNWVKSELPLSEGVTWHALHLFTMQWNGGTFNDYIRETAKMQIGWKNRRKQI